LTRKDGSGGGAGRRGAADFTGGRKGHQRT
jgi:hypothetical protein